VEAIHLVLCHQRNHHRQDVKKRSYEIQQCADVILVVTAEHKNLKVPLLLYTPSLKSKMSLHTFLELPSAKNSITSKS